MFAGEIVSPLKSTKIQLWLQYIQVHLTLIGICGCYGRIDPNYWFCPVFHLKKKKREYGSDMIGMIKLVRKPMFVEYLFNDLLLVDLFYCLMLQCSHMCNVLCD